MKIDFLLNNINIITLSLWTIFLFIVALRFFSPRWFNSNNAFLSKIINCIKNTSFKKLILITILLNIAYGAFVTWGQYHVWSSATDFTVSLVELPLPKEAPLANFLEWLRPLFEKDFGYFLYYILGRVWLNIFITLLVSTSLYFIFRIWKSYHGNFQDNGPELLFVLMLVAGWPGVLVFIPLGFIISVLLSLFFYFKGKKTVEIESSFLVASFLVLFLGKLIMGFL